MPPPAVNAAGHGWAFSDADHRTVVLRVERMHGYREDLEWRIHAGAADIAEPGTAPSAVALLRDMVLAARAAGSDHLVVDVRGNTGGNSMFGVFLGYFLHGPEPVRTLDEGYQVRRYSRLMLETYPAFGTVRPAGVEATGGYDFQHELAWRAGEATGTSPEEWAEIVAAMPSFAAEVEAGDLAGAWNPRVTVVTDSGTISAAYDLTTLLWRLGARTVGVPPAQAGNCFTDLLLFSLPHSGIRVGVAYKISLKFPDDPERGRLFRPDRELTYADLAAHGFDPHTALRVALDTR